VPNWLGWAFGTRGRTFHRMLKLGASNHAGVTQLVECLLPKQNVVGSSPITRSAKMPKESAKTATRAEWPSSWAD
jgi:hypothetical protein